MGFSWRVRPFRWALWAFLCLGLVVPGEGYAFFNWLWKHEDAIRADRACWQTCRMGYVGQEAFYPEANTSCVPECMRQHGREGLTDAQATPRDRRQQETGGPGQGQTRPPPGSDQGRRASTEVPGGGQTSAYEGQQAAAAQGARQAGADRARVETVIADARSLREERLQTAEQVLDRWAQGRGGASQMPAEEQRRYEFDQRLVRRASQELRREGDFTEAHARQAHHWAVRELLVSATQLEGIRQEGAQESNRLLQLMQTLQVLGRESQKRSHSLDSVGANALAANGLSEGNGAPESRSKLANASGLTEGRAPASAAGGRQTIEDAARASHAGGKDSEGGLGLAADSLDPKKNLSAKSRHSLKEQLRAKLKGGASSGSSPSPGSSPWSKLDSNLEEGRLSRALDQEGWSAGEGSKAPPLLATMEEAFTLAGAETEAEVARMKGEAERLAGEQNFSQGILSETSLGLFERVHGVYQACARRSCVRVGAGSGRSNP